MTEIKVGEYARYKDGTISKVLDINENETFDLLCENFTLSSKFVVKHSKNIIDLIQAGDYVNGYKIYTDDILRKYIVVWEEQENYYIKIYLQSIDIKSILTKEQFENNSYKVVE